MRLMTDRSQLNNCTDHHFDRCQIVWNNCFIDLNTVGGPFDPDCKLSIALPTTSLNTQ